MFLEHGTPQQIELCLDKFASAHQVIPGLSGVFCLGSRTAQELPRGAPLAHRSLTAPNVWFGLILDVHQSFKHSSLALQLQFIAPGGPKLLAGKFCIPLSPDSCSRSLSYNDNPIYID